MKKFMNVYGFINLPLNSQLNEGFQLGLSQTCPTLYSAVAITNLATAIEKDFLWHLSLEWGGMLLPYQDLSTSL